MFYQSFPIDTQPRGGLVYALAFTDANYIQVGLGHQSMSGLQTSHVMTLDLHHKVAVEHLRESFKNGNTGLLTRKLAPYFGGALVELDEGQQARLLEMVEQVRKEAFGHPLDWEPRFIDLPDGRIVWIAYGDEIDKIRIGLGYFNDSGERILGEQSYAVGLNSLPLFVKELWESGAAMLFMGRPPRWPVDYQPFIGGDTRKTLATEIVRLADEVWPGKVG